MTRFALSRIYLRLLFESIRVRLGLLLKLRVLSNELAGGLEEEEGSLSIISHETIRMIPHFASFLSRLPWARSCLTKALTIRRTLQRRGIKARIKIGAHSNLNTLDIHAWLEVGGVTFLKGTAPFNEFRRPINGTVPRGG